MKKLIDKFIFYYAINNNSSLPLLNNPPSPNYSTSPPLTPPYDSYSFTYSSPILPSNNNNYSQVNIGNTLEDSLPF